MADSLIHKYFLLKKMKILNMTILQDLSKLLVNMRMTISVIMTVTIYSNAYHALEMVCMGCH